MSNSYNDDKLQSQLGIPDSKILHDFAILRMSKMDSLPDSNYELLTLYNSIVADLVEFLNEYSFGE